MPASPTEVSARSIRAPQVLALGSDLSDDVVQEWRTLAARLDGTAYFQTPDWVLAWWNTVAARPPTSVACWRDADGTLAAVVALSRVRHRVFRALPLTVPLLVNAGSGSGDADHCGPLVDPSRRADVAEWLFDAAAGRSLLLRNVDGSTAAPPSGVRPFGTTTCPRLHLAGTDQPVARSANFRRQLGRFERQLTGAGVRFDWHPSGTVDAPILDALFALHGSRRDALNAGTSLGDRHRALLAALSRTATVEHGPAAVVARVDPRIVGVLLGFRWKDTFSAYQSGWDPVYASSSLGSVLVHNAIRLAAVDGIRLFDLLRGTEPYKYRFGAVDAYDHSYLLVRNGSGRLLPFEQRLRTAVRRINRSRSKPRTDHPGGAPR